jgi:hypothetical protein
VVAALLPVAPAEPEGVGLTLGVLVLLLHPAANRPTAMAMTPAFVRLIVLAPYCWLGGQVFDLTCWRDVDELTANGVAEIR